MRLNFNNIVKKTCILNLKLMMCGIKLITLIKYYGCMYMKALILHQIDDLHVCFFSSSNATALTINNIIRELRGVDLFKIEYGKTILGIPRAQLAELQSAHHSTDEQEAAVVRYWLLRDPLASWRRIIYQLDWWADLGYGHYADRIRHYAEELTGMFFNDTTLSMYRYGLTWMA